MPKQLPYPKFKLQDCLEFCELIAYYPNITLSDAASLQQKQLSGHFMNLISSCVKFGLLKHQKGKLDIKPLALSCLSKNKTLNLGSFSENQLQACLQALDMPEGFSFLHQHWLNTKKLDSTLVASHLNVSLQHSKKAKDVIIDSLTWLYSQKTTFSLKNSLTSNTPPINLEAKNTVANKPSTQNYSFSLKGPNLNIELTINSSDNLNLAKQILDTISSDLKNIK